MGKCGLCKYSQQNGNEDFTCCNEDSEYYGLETDYDECCVDYESKDGEDE